MLDDQELLRGWAESRDATALRQLIARHAGLVYWSAMRQLADPALAAAAMQSTCVMMAMTAAKLARSKALAAWLIERTVLICQRQVHQSSAGVAPAYASQSDWRRIGALLDVTLVELSEPHRQALLLKYAMNLSLRDCAAAMGVEDAIAGRRISAGVSQLAGLYGAANVPVSPETLVASIQAHMVRPAPEQVIEQAIAGCLSDAPGPEVLETLHSVQSQSRNANLITGGLVLVAVVIGTLAVFKMIGWQRNNLRIAATQTAPPTSQPLNVPPAVNIKEHEPATREIKAKPIKQVDPEMARMFIAAIERSDFESVAKLLDREEALVNAIDEKSKRPAIVIAAELVLWKRTSATRIAHLLIDNGAAVDLHTAARAGHADYVYLTLKMRPDWLNLEDANGLTPLQRAALIPGSSADCEVVVDLLIRSGARVDIWTACTFARLEDVEKAIAADASLINQPLHGATPLQWAARPRRYTDDPLAIANALIDKGADVKARDTSQDGMTPLHHAAAWGDQAALAQLLLDKGAAVNIADDFGRSPVDFSMERGHKQMTAFLLSKGGVRTSVDHPFVSAKTPRIFSAVQSGDAAGVKLLLDDTPELAKSHGATGQTPMHEAALIGSMAIIDLLLIDKADLNAPETNKFGGTPLEWAIRGGKPDTLKHLLAKGADPEITNARTGRTLLHAAAIHTDDAALIDLLISKGIDPAAKDRAGKTAREYAVSTGHLQAAEHLPK